MFDKIFMWDEKGGVNMEFFNVDESMTAQAATTENCTTNGTTQAGCTQTNCTKNGCTQYYPCS